MIRIWSDLQSAWLKNLVGKFLDCQTRYLSISSKILQNPSKEAVDELFEPDLMPR